MQDLADSFRSFQSQVAAAERRCVGGLGSSIERAAACAERVRKCTKGIGERELEWSKEKLALRNELRSIYTRFSATQEGSSAQQDQGRDAQQDSHMEKKHLQKAVQEYSGMVHSLEETCRRLSHELDVGKHEHALSTGRASALVGDLDAILAADLSGGKSNAEAMRQRALERIRAFKEDPAHISGRPTSLSSIDGGLLSPRSTSWTRADGRPSSTASAQGAVSDYGFAAKSEAELQSGMRKTSSKVDQLVQIAQRLASHDHDKIFQGTGRTEQSAHARTRSTVGLVLSSDCVVQNIVTGGPAFQSRQFTPGDKIVAVDGVRVDASSIHAAMRGSDVVGSMVEVSVVPPGADDLQIRQVKMARADADQIADRLEMMEIFARLKVLVQEHHGQFAVEATTMVDKMMFTYSRGLTAAAESERKVRANLSKLEQQERQRLGELLQGLDTVESQQRTNLEYAMQTIKALNIRMADERERSDQTNEALRVELARVCRERDAASDSLTSMLADLERLRGARGEADALSDRVADLLQAVQSLSNNLEECKLKNLALENERSSLEEQKDSLHRDSEEIKSTLERALARMTNLNNDLTMQADSQRSEIEHLNKSLREWSAHSERLSAELSETHQVLCPRHKPPRDGAHDPASITLRR